MIGRRYTIVCALTLSFVAITMEFVATTNPVFFGGKLINGIAVGTLQTIAGTYVGEVCHTRVPSYTFSRDPDSYYHRSSLLLSADS